MADEKAEDGLLAADEVIDTPVKIDVEGKRYALRILDFTDYTDLIQEVRNRQLMKEIKRLGDKAKPEDIDGLRERFKRFDMNIDQLAAYCFSMDGIPHVLEASLRKNGHSDEEAVKVAKAIIRTQGAQPAASIAGMVSGLFPPPTKKKAEGAENPPEGKSSDTSTTS